MLQTIFGVRKSLYLFSLPTQNSLLRSHMLSSNNFFFSFSVRIACQFDEWICRRGTRESMIIICIFFLFLLFFSGLDRACTRTWYVCIPYGQNGESTMINSNTCAAAETALCRRRIVDSLEGLHMCYLCCKWDIIFLDAHCMCA